MDESKLNFKEQNDSTNVTNTDFNAEKSDFDEKQTELDERKINWDEQKLSLDLQNLNSFNNSFLNNFCSIEESMQKTVDISDEISKNADLRSAPFLNEDFVKSDEFDKFGKADQSGKADKSGKAGLRYGVAALFLSSLITAVSVVFIMEFVLPIIKPTFQDYVGMMLLGKKIKETAVVENNMGGIYKKVEIEKSNSPIVAIAEKVGPSVVGIKVTVRIMDFFFGERESEPQGSGVIIRSDGYIMTNNHVVSDALSSTGNRLLSGTKIEIILPTQVDKPYTATVVGRDAKTDLAVLKIDASGLPIVEFGNSDDIKVGELAIAIGNPGGLEYMGSVTAGIISGINRTIPAEDGRELKLIQTDAAINPGNSGGALVNSQGQLIGVNTAKIGGQGYEGLGFAIPINKAKDITGNLIQYKYVKGRPLFGITADPRFNETMAVENGVPNGVLVADVSPLTGAYKAGIQRGDIIIKFDGKKVTSVSEINDLKNNHKPNDIVEVEVYRDGEVKKLQVKLSEEISK